MKSIRKKLWKAVNKIFLAIEALYEWNNENENLKFDIKIEQKKIENIW
jgi:hypothetical protein